MTGKTQNDRLTDISRATAIENALIAIVVSIIIAATVLRLGDQILSLFQQITTAFGGKRRLNRLPRRWFPCEQALKVWRAVVIALALAVTQVNWYRRHLGNIQWDFQPEALHPR